MFMNSKKTTISPKIYTDLVGRSRAAKIFSGSVVTDARVGWKLLYNRNFSI